PTPTAESFTFPYTTLFRSPLLVQRQCGVERRLPTHGGQQRIRALGGDDLRDDLWRDRLDVCGVGQLRIRHDGGRIGVDQNDPIPDRKSTRLNSSHVKISYA